MLQGQICSDFSIRMGQSLKDRWLCSDHLVLFGQTARFASLSILGQGQNTLSCRQEDKLTPLWKANTVSTSANLRQTRTLDLRGRLWNTSMCCVLCTLCSQVSKAACLSRELTRNWESSDCLNRGHRLWEWCNNSWAQKTWETFEEWIYHRRQWFSELLAGAQVLWDILGLGTAQLSFF